MRLLDSVTGARMGLGFSCKARSVLVVGFLASQVILGPAVHADEAAPKAVSPVGESGVALVEAQCPTFSWTTIEGEGGYELVVYRVRPETHEATLDEKPALWVGVPDGANSWTPGLERCLDPGQRYAWSIRAIREGDPSWSQPSVFEIVPRAAAEDIRQAVEILRRELASQSASQIESRTQESDRTQDRTHSTQTSSPRRSRSPSPAGQSATQGGSSFDVDGSGNVVANSFTGSGVGLTGVAADTATTADSAASATTASALAVDPQRCSATDAMSGILANGDPFGCIDVVDASELATQLATHSASSDHDGRYAPLTGQQVTGNLSVRATPGTSDPGVTVDGSDNQSNGPALRVVGDLQVQGAATNSIYVDGVIRGECRKDSLGRPWDEVGIWCIDPVARAGANGLSSIQTCHAERAMLCPLEAILTCDAANLGDPTLNSCGVVTDTPAPVMVLRTLGHDGNASGSAFDELLSYNGSGNLVAPVDDSVTLPFFCCSLAAGL
ncbi:MAG: hypothetical protein K8J08_16685 [Thermoanaerobaculia bacterium]|nr:hypothetical protein [Thermoanaerobaculia bacterium]